MGAQTRTSLQYLDNDRDLAIYIASTGGGEVVPHEGNYRFQEVSLIDARKSGVDFSLDENGFRLVNLSSDVKDFYNDTEVRNIYDQEIQQLVMAQTGASSVEVFDHTRRTASETLRKQKKIREPASIIHNDYTENSARKRLQDLYPEIAESLGERRFAIINVWRSINGVVRNHALCMCDAATVAPNDLVPVVRQAKDRLGEIQLAVFNPEHRWYFFPEMDESEAMLFKTFDSATDGRARYTIHTAFNDPQVPEDAPARESIESRCFVFF